MVRAAHKSTVPVALHLDHAHTYEGVMKAIRWGFTSVMFDGSALPFTENLKRTKEITRIAHSLGLTVEGELGYSGCFDQNVNVTSMYTEMAVDFVEKTNIDALAVGVSNNHGKCPGNLNLNFNRVADEYTGSASGNAWRL